MPSRARHEILSLVLIGWLPLLLPCGPGTLEAGDSRPPRHGVSTEVFFPEDRDHRDIRVLGVTGEREGVVVGDVWVGGAVGLVVTEGVLRPDERGREDVEREADGGGLWVGGFLRWRPGSGAGLAPYLEAGAGMIFAPEAFPPGGTAWNFTQRWGLGVTVRLANETILAVGWRRLHVSNGKGAGHPRNPSYDGSGLTVSVLW